MKEYDVKEIRKHFPALSQKVDGQQVVFFDGPGGTQVPKSVADAMGYYLRKHNSNLINSPFFSVVKTHEVVAEARKKAAIFVNAPKPENIVFGATMTALTAHLSRSICQEWNAGDEIIVTELDHSANVSFWQRCADERGVTCCIARVNTQDSTLDYDHLESLISSKTKLVAFTLASNVSGSATDAKRIMKAAKSVNAMTYIDSVHAAPHFLPDVQDLDCDFLACSAYKFHGPHLGFLYGKQEHLERLTPYKVEPAPEESPECWEMGTKSFEALEGLCATISYMSSYHDKGDMRESLRAFYNDIFAYEKQLAKAFLKRAEQLPAMKIYGIKDINKLDQRTPTFGFTLDGHHPQAVSDHLANAGISTGAGHFYAKGLIDALGLAESGGVVRAGMVHYNTIEEVDRFFETLKEL